MTAAGTIAVTGVRGRVGRAVASALAAQGHRVRGLARVPVRRAETDERQRYPIHPLDLTAPDRLEASLAGVSAVVHCAGLGHEEADGLDEAQVFEVNTVAPVRLALAAERAGVGHFVQISSTATLAIRDASRRAPVYARSKGRAEVLVPGAFAGVTAVLRLGWVIDPEDPAAYGQLWPDRGKQLIVGALPVPMIALRDVAVVVGAVLSRRVGGTLDVVAGCPHQAELFAFAASLCPRPYKVIDVGSARRLRRMRDVLGQVRDDPTWLTASEPHDIPEWISGDGRLAAWRDCVRELYARGRAGVPVGGGADAGR